MKAEGQRKQQFNQIRDWFMVELGLFTGLRVMEVQNLRIGDLLIRSNMSSVHVRNGKGGKPRDVYINAELKYECMEFLQLRNTFDLPGGHNDFVFCKSNGKPVTTRCLKKRSSIAWRVPG